ncbi:uncharacterized protein LOC109421414 [Aedes albopictus]|uniref:Secreted protein n=1 Tax=Aedes albopictus TaxID=7160 RepID=A0ABM1YFF7_AEDAL|nr:uncharacterized protein LOC115265522 [Aedes albopictus]
MSSYETYEDLTRGSHSHEENCVCVYCGVIKQMKIACARVVTRQPTPGVAPIPTENQAPNDPGIEEPANVAARRQMDSLRTPQPPLPGWDDIETKLEQQELLRRIAYQFMSDSSSEDEQKPSTSGIQPTEGRAEAAELDWEVVNRQKYDPPKEEFCNVSDLEDAYKDLEEEEGKDKN